MNSTETTTSKEQHSSEASTAAMERLQADYDAFQKSSTQLEQELEEELQCAKTRVASFEEQYRRLEQESKGKRAELIKQVRPR